MRLVYMGTPDFAVKPLELLYASRHEILAVATSPDKPRGRGRIISPTAVKKAALKLELPILQPNNLKNDIFIAELKKYGRDDILVIAGGVIPQQDYDFLFDAGVTGVFGPGTKISESAISILNVLMKDVQ